MTAEPDIDPSPAPIAAHEPARRSGSIVLVLLVAGGIVAAAIALMTIGRAQAQPYILGLLALLAMVGLFNLFAFAAGIIRFADRAADDPVTSRIADHAYDGLAVTDPRGHVVYSNAAYLALTGAATALDARPVERVFIGNPDVSEAVFRLLKAAREGKRQQEEVRIAGQPKAATAAGCGCGYGRSARASARRNTRCGRFRTSPATANARRTCSRNCSMRSNISIMRHAGSSRSMPPATSSMSTRRWRTGSITISRRSARAA